MIKYKIVCVFCAFVVLFTANAQNSFPNDTLKNRVQNAVDEFNYNLYCSVNTNLTDNQHKNEIKAALSLFVGKGASFSFTNKYGELENHAFVRIQKSNINHVSRRWIPMKNILWSFYKNIHRYGKFVIKSADTVYIGNIVVVSDPNYEAKAQYIPNCINLRDGVSVFKGNIKKKMRINIESISLPNSTLIYPVELGDVISFT